MKETEIDNLVKNAYDWLKKGREQYEAKHKNDASDSFALDGSCGNFFKPVLTFTDLKYDEKGAMSTIENSCKLKIAKKFAEKYKECVVLKDHQETLDWVKEHMHCKYFRYRAYHKSYKPNQ